MESNCEQWVKQFNPGKRKQETMSRKTNVGDAAIAFGVIGSLLVVFALWLMALALPVIVVLYLIFHW